MDKDLEKIKELYLTGDIDSEDYKDNLDQINEWESTIRQNTDLAEWQNHDITKSIVKMFKEEYVANAVILGTNNKLSEEDRQKIWSKQSAINFLLTFMVKDTKSIINQISLEIKQAIARVE